MVTPKKDRPIRGRPRTTKPDHQASDATDRDSVQGEGDYRSAREFNEDERAFVESHDTEALGRRARPDDAEEAAELDDAEREGKSHARPDPEADESDDTDIDPDDVAQKGRS